MGLVAPRWRTIVPALAPRVRGARLSIQGQACKQWVGAVTWIVTRIVQRLHRMQHDGGAVVTAKGRRYLSIPSQPSGI